MEENSPEKILYDYTKSFSSGLAIAEGFSHTLLPNLYIENKERVDKNLTPLVFNGDYPDRYAQAYSEALDKIGDSFGVVRGPGEPDRAYRQKIKLVLVQSPTLSGLKNSVERLFLGFGLNVGVEVTPAFKNSFDAVSTSFDVPFRGELGARSYRIVIDLSPSLKEVIPRYVDKVVSGFPYRIKKPGNYRITFDPQGTFGSSREIVLSKKDIQNPVYSEEVLLNDRITRFGKVVDLGFLTNFDELILDAPTSVLYSYEAFLQFNDSVFDFYRNPSYNGLLSAFGVTLLRDIFSNVLPQGVEIERISLAQAGSGG